MKINKKLKRRIALAIVLGVSFYGVAEAGIDFEGNSPIYLYGNSSSVNHESIPQEGIEASGYIFDFNRENVEQAFGAYTTNANSISNIFNHNGGNASEVCGGHAHYGNAIGNIVNIYNVKNPFYMNDIIGGEAFSGSANNNTVNINTNDDLNYANVYGGQAITYKSSSKFTANNNIVNVNSDVKNIFSICAGHSQFGTYEADKAGNVNIAADYNNVVIDADAEINNIVGGRCFIGDVYSKPLNESNLEMSLSNNKIVINKGNISYACAVEALLGSDMLNSNNDSHIKILDNSIIVNNGKCDYIMLSDIEYPGEGSDKVFTEISNNNVTIKDGVIGNIILFRSSGELSKLLGMKNNSINIEGGVITGSIEGGPVIADIEEKYANNTLNWYGGDIKGNIKGFYSFIDNESSFQKITCPESYFNFYASKNNSNKTIGSLGNFENYNFYLDNTVTANTTLINLTGTADLRNSNVGVAVLGSSPLKTGDSVTLLSANSKGAIQTSDNLKNDTSHMRAENISAVYDFTLKNDGMKLTATVGNATPDTNTTDTSGINTNPKAENLMEGRAAEAFMTYDKLDIVDKAYQASKHSSTPTTFLDYSYSDVTTKDNTKLRGMNMVWGAASTIGGEKDQGNTLTRGVFLEYGDNSFSSDDHYYNGSIWGSGKGKKTGIGVLLRKVMFDRHYYDAYLRAGTLNTDYSALAEGVGRIKYDNKDLYVSGHLGYGQFIQLTPNLQMDAYAKYFYNRIPGHSTTAYTNDIDPMPISFDTFTNHRLRLGSKFTWDYMDSNNYLFYVDAAIEHERSSDQSGTINGRRISKSNESGTTGVIELGYENNFGFNNAFKFTAKAQGYLGDRRGIGASANISYSF